MELRYYINTTQIAEPIGFDDFKTILKRTEQHGVSAESSVGSLEFDGVGFGMIKTAYDTDIDSELIFKAEIKCNDLSEWEEDYKGVIDLSTFEENKDDYCSCKVKIGEIGVKTTFNNRVETVVDLDSLISLDGDVLPVYDNLRKEITIAAKPIEYTSLMTTPIESNVLLKAITSSVGLTTQFAFNGISIAELSGYNEVLSLVDTVFNFDYYFYKKLDADLQSLNAKGIAKFSVKTSAPITLSKCEMWFRKSSAPTVNIASYSFNKIHSDTKYIDYELDFNISSVLALNEKIICSLRFETTSNVTISVKCNTDSVISITSSKLGADSTSPVFLAHESFSRVSEIISGLTVKSEWFSRSNSNVNKYYNTNLFLPSIAELQLIRDNLYAFSVGDFEGNWWSSSEVDADYAWWLQFIPNTQRNDGYKTSFSSVGAIACTRYAISGSQVYNLRDVGREGGYIFYVVAVTSGFEYYEALYKYTNLKWSNDLVLVGGTLNTVGAGINNTNLIATNETTAAYKTRTGCGGGALRSLSTGLMIRNAVFADGSIPKLYTSFKDLFKNFSVIDNLGFGFSFENGTLFLRVEKKEWFYNSNVIFTINNPAKKSRTINGEKVYSSLKIGYDKFVEKDELNAIKTYHTIREYTTKLKAIDNKLESICKYIADPFAIEITRKLAAVEDTKDWKYDDNTFLICLEMNKSDNVFIVEKDNISISPARNAINFHDMFFYSNITALFNFFTGGSGAVESENKMDVVDYRFHNKDNGNYVFLKENANVPRKESFLKPEIIEFEYPLTRSEYDAIKADPYGIITVDGEDCYIDEIMREPMTSLCNFKLIPKI